MEHRSVDFREDAIRAALGGLALGGLRVLQRVGSTNDEALAWARVGAADASVVVADEQTAARGRAGRTWLTPPATALALSLILHNGESAQMAGRLAGLGALSVVQACSGFGLYARIKWPNDVLVGGRKVAGILVEAQWSGEHLQASIIGIGINVLRGSTPARGLRYPATSLEEALGRSLDRIEVLRAVLSNMLGWRARLHTQEFLNAWEEHLAFAGDLVTLTRDGGPAIIGRLLGLQEDGSLRLLTDSGEQYVAMGEIQLQPPDDTI